METVRIPIWRFGMVVAWAQVDASDAHLSAGARWCLLKRPSNNTAYAERHVVIDGRNTKEQMHRAVLGLPQKNGLAVDHINGDGLDNRRANLRVCSQGQNSQNLTALKRDNTSGYRGVTFHSRLRKWQAQVKVDGRNHYLGLFSTPEAAHTVASAFRAQHMPFSSDAQKGAPA